LRTKYAERKGAARLPSGEVGSRAECPEGSVDGRFRVDLHVHTARYSPCAEAVPPIEIGAWAARAGLGGVVLTDHDILWTREEVDALAPHSCGVRLFRGIECTARGAHLVLIGLEDAGAITRGSDVAEICALAHAQGAAVVLAHPFRSGSPASLPLGLVDAIEVASTSFSAEEAARSARLAGLVSRPQVAGSDAHALSLIGWAWTEFPSAPTDERELANMIRSGRCAPQVPQPYSS
jgi:predicted metal-dependent phosphoesterase TrpH